MASESPLSFGKGEIEALKEIALDWLHEEIVIPPFKPEVAIVLKKLGIEVEDTGSAALSKSRKPVRGAPGPATA